MVGRFVDDLEFVKDANDFVKKHNKMSLLWIIALFVLTFTAIIGSLYFYERGDFTVTVIIIASSLGLLFSRIYSFILKERDVVTATELQNAIFSGAVQLVTDLCIIVRKDGRISYVNPRYLKILSNAIAKRKKHYYLDDLVTAGLIEQSDKERLMESFRKSKNTTVKFNISKPNDLYQTDRFSLHQVGIDEDKFASKGLKLSTQPITRPSGFFMLESEKTDFATINENKKLSFVKNFQVGYYELDNKGIINHIDACLVEILGKEKNSILGKSLSEITNIEIQDYDRSFEDIFKIKNENKVTFAFIGHKNIIESPYNKANKNSSCGLVFLFNDFKYLDNEQRPKGELFDEVKDYPLSTAIINKFGNILKSNKAFRSIFKISANEWELKLDDILKCSNGTDFDSFLNDFINDETTSKTSIEVEIKNEKNKSASLYISKIDKPFDKTDKFIISLIDTTEIKNLEMSFTHSQKMQAVGQLAGGIAHDFNNLLTAMLGFCDLLLDKHSPSDPSFANIMQIQQNANRAANLVKQLLAFSRKQTLQPKVIDITDIIADLSNLIGRLIGEKITLEMYHGKDIGNVRVDKGQLEQVIINLAVNARDAMKNGGKLIIRTSNVKISSRDSLSDDLIPTSINDQITNGEYILIEVVDNGCGMEKEQISKIFDPFFSTKDLGAGTGLGLSTVYGIIKQTNGYIYVSTEIDKGTNFSIFLKRCHDKVDENSLDEDKEKSNPKSNIDLRGSSTILLVEDEEPVRIFSTNALKSKGYNVLSPETVEEALEIIMDKGNEIDLVVSDVMMPGMNGPDMIKEAHKKYPDLKVVFVSGYGEDAFKETYGNDRHFNFLSKPYSLKQLAQKVKEVIEEG